MSNPPIRPDPNQPMSDDIKLAVAFLQDARPNFRLAGWAGIGAQRSMTTPTAKIRFQNLKRKYLAETANEAAVAPTAAPHDDEEKQGEGEDDMPTPTTRHGTQSTAKGDAGEESPVPAHHRFADPKPCVFPNLGRSAQSSAQSYLEADPASSNKKARDDEYEANRLEWNLRRGWAVPRDNTFQEWIYPGEGHGQGGQKLPEGEPGSDRPLRETPEGQKRSNSCPQP
ncbi:hypothetical protein PG988_003254 [Apiospora saccharicola]